MLSVIQNIFDLALCTSIPLQMNMVEACKILQAMKHQCDMYAYLLIQQIGGMTLQESPTLHF